MADALQIEVGRDYEVIADGVSLLIVEQPAPGSARGNAVVLKNGDVVHCVVRQGGYHHEFCLFEFGDFTGELNVEGGMLVESVLKVKE